MKELYSELKPVYKHGAVLKFDDYLCDSPVVFRYGDRWIMSYIKIDKRLATGYTTFLATSDDLVNWREWGQILTDSNGWDDKQTGGYAQFIDPVFGGSNRIMKINGKYRFAYIGGNLSGYETDPLHMGYASADDVLDAASYKKKEKPILSPCDSDARCGETKTVYKPSMFVDDDEVTGYPYVCAYNAKNETDRESIFLAVSDDGENWKRFGDKAVMSIFELGDGYRILGDPQIVKKDGIYIMFYFVYNSEMNKAYNTFAVSEDLVNWETWDGEPLVESEYEWENVFAHKQWVVKTEDNIYHYYCAVNDKGERYIALATVNRI